MLLFGTTQELGAHQSRFQLIRFALRQVRHHVAHAVVVLAHLHFLGRGDILQVLYTLHHVTHLCASINTYAQGLTTLIACTIVSAHQTTGVVYSCRHIYCCCPAHPNTRTRVHTNIRGITHAYNTHTHTHTHTYTHHVEGDSADVRRRSRASARAITRAFARAITRAFARAIT